MPSNNPSEEGGAPTAASVPQPLTTPKQEGPDVGVLGGGPAGTLVPFGVTGEALTDLSWIGTSLGGLGAGDLLSFR